MGEKSFCESFYQTLNEDENYRKYLDNLVFPSKKAKAKTVISTAVGLTVAAAVGIGWTSHTTMGIIFKDCPISFARFEELSLLQAYKVSFYLQTSYPKNSRKALSIERKTEGRLFHKEITGVRLRPIEGIKDRDPVRERIESDQELLTDLLQLFKTKVGWKDAIGGGGPGRINIGIMHSPITQIEATLARDAPPNVIRDFFGCILRIASHVRLGSLEP